MNNNTRGWLATIIAFALGALFLFLFALNASADEPAILTIDGVEYEAYQDNRNPSGQGAVHWFTPTVPTPNVVTFAERNQTWNGINGAEHLEDCDEIHWVSNPNRLVISHCETETPPTTTITTSIPTTTTTTVKETTTTNGEESTTTTNPQETTTSAPSSSTTNPSPTTTEAPSTSATLPYTGIDDPLALGVLGLLLGSTGGLILAATRKGNDEEDI